MEDKQQVLDYLEKRLPHVLSIAGSIEIEMDLILKLLIALLDRHTDLTTDEQTLVTYAKNFLVNSSVDFSDLTNTDETKKLDDSNLAKAFTRTQQKLYYDWLRARGMY